MSGTPAVQAWQLEISRNQTQQFPMNSGGVDLLGDRKTPGNVFIHKVILGGWST